MSESAVRRRNSAQAKAKNSMNKSTAKAQFTFPKSDRFPARMYSSVSDLKFYNIVSKKYDRKISFGTSKRTDFANKNNVPAPTAYQSTSQTRLRSTGVTFKAGRDQCKHNSVFQSNSNPGPGAYKPISEGKFKAVHYSLGKRIETTDTNQEDIPGPKYDIASPLLDQNKFLSIYVRRNTTKIFPSKTCYSRKVEKVYTEPSFLLDDNAPNKIITSKGTKNLGQNAPNVIINRSKKISSLLRKNDVPGPGHYEAFSEFVSGDSQNF